MVISVKRRGGTTGLVGVDFATSDGTALSGRDYLATNGTLSFPTGETLRTFLVPIIDNFVTNDDRFFSLALSGFSGGALSGPQPVATVLILNDDSAVGFTSANFSVSENTLSGNATITFQRTYATNHTVSVTFRTVTGGTAPPFVKYIPTNSVVTFLPGEVTKSANVRIINETNTEGNQTVFLVLTNAVSTPPGTTTYIDIPAATLTIIDDDFGPGAISFSASSYSVPENGTNVAITLLRSGGSLGVVSVQFSTGGGTATAGVDYVPQGGQLTFGQGQTNRTIFIPILDDSLVEGDETFVVNIFNPLGGVAITGRTNVTVTIVENDFLPGTVDPGFDPKGGANNFVRALVAQADGRVVIGGAFTSFDNTNRQYIARLNTNGALDLTFNPGSGARALVVSVASLPDARVVLGGGFTNVNGVAFNRVARLNSNGSPDLALSQGPIFDAAADVVATYNDGRIIVGGGFSLPAHGVLRLLVNGSVDPSFNPGTGASGPVHCVGLQDNGQVIIGGSFTSLNGVSLTRVARLNSDGSLDQSFAPTAITNGNVYGVATQPDGKVVLGGDFSITGKSNSVGVARLNVDGSLDSGFDPGSGANGTVYAIGLQSQGKVILAGSFTTVNNTNRIRLARLNTNGSLDLLFSPGGGANNTIYALAVLPDDDLVVAGDFTTFDGLVRNRVARIQANDAALKIVKIKLLSGQPQITISSLNGRIYVLQSSQNLSTWQDVSTTNSSGRTTTLIDPAPAAFSRFYRVRLVP